MHWSVHSYSLGSLEIFYPIADLVPTLQTMRMSKTQGLFYREPQTITADCRICHQRWNRKTLTNI